MPIAMDRDDDDALADLESAGNTTFPYAPLLYGEDAFDAAAASTTAVLPSRWNTPFVALATAATLLLALVGLLSRSAVDHAPQHRLPSLRRGPSSMIKPLPAAAQFGRGVKEGVSEKSSGVERKEWYVPFSWTDEMLRWQRTAYHFQPEKNWMNDPDGPLYYKGWYHIFYQYNPDSALWANISWGHSASRDLIRWTHLPLAMDRDRWYDEDGVWTGSATILPDGGVVMLYTGSTNESVQVQNLAVPANLSDPLLVEWVKSDANPVLYPPPGVGPLDFRDPTTAWYVGSDDSWRIAIGSKDDSTGNHTGLVHVYRTWDFIKFEMLPGTLHQVDGTGMWECVDIFPVAVEGKDGLDTSETAGPGVKHVLKASMDDDRYDCYAIGTYNAEANSWVPDDPKIDVGLGLRYDYGTFYAAKSFFDPKKRRRVMWGWIDEVDTERVDLQKGWASVMGIPRRVWYDSKTEIHLLQWPVEEVEELRVVDTAKNFTSVTVAAGDVVPLDVGKVTDQLDIIAEFEIPQEAFDPEAAVWSDDAAEYTCGTSGGAKGRGALGPFGLLVLADDDRAEQTAIYFYIVKTADGKRTFFVCHDELRSSKANDVLKGVQGAEVHVLEGEKLSLRILVDHSIVETFAQGGRICITSRIYPTEAFGSKARLMLFNNATGANITASIVKAWEMSVQEPSAAGPAAPLVLLHHAVVLVWALLFWFSSFVV